MIAIWLHDAMLSDTDISLRTHPTAPRFFLFDEEHLQVQPVAFHRLQFIYESLLELQEEQPAIPLEIHRGKLAEVAAEFLQRRGIKELVTTDHPDPYVRQSILALRKLVPVRVYPRDTLTDVGSFPRRFSRYWDKHAKDVLGYIPKKGRMR